MSDEEQNKDFACFATASTLLAGSAETVAGTAKPNINLQLADWKEIKRRYFEKQNNFSPEDMVFIINHLTSSLSNLFGANYCIIRSKTTTIPLESCHHSGPKLPPFRWKVTNF